MALFGAIILSFKFAFIGYGNAVEHGADGDSGACLKLKAVLKNSCLLPPPVGDLQATHFSISESQLGPPPDAQSVLEMGCS
jgi:hypothetical protein